MTDTRKLALAVLLTVAVGWLLAHEGGLLSPSMSDQKVMPWG